MAADTISFARGAPSLDIVDVEGLKAAAKRAFENDPAGLTGYGTAIGYPPLRQWIADQHQVEPQNVIVTNGSMQADAFLFDQLVAPGDPVVVERPTYDRTLLGLRQRGADIRPIELEPDGIDVEGVGRLISDGIRPKLAHVIPNFQNPAGHTLSRDKRDGLLALAHQLIAAKLNVAAGADGSAVATTITAADALVAGLVVPPVGDGSLDPGVTATYTATLAAFNEGAIGPGACVPPDPGPD